MIWVCLRELCLWFNLLIYLHVCLYGCILDLIVCGHLLLFVWYVAKLAVVLMLPLQWRLLYLFIVCF